MAILESEVFITVGFRVTPHYEKLGYEIPKTVYENKTSKISGAKMLVKVLDLTEGSHVKLTVLCDEEDCDGVVIRKYSSVLKCRESFDGKDRCLSCSAKLAGYIKLNNVKYEQTLEYYAKNNNKEYLLAEFSNKNTKTPSEIGTSAHYTCHWECFVCDSTYEMKVVHRRNGNNCPYCRGMRVNHTNSLWSTNPELANLLVDKNKGHTLTRGVAKKEEFHCLDCGNVQIMAIEKIVRSGFNCAKCSDGISYPEKFLMNFLDQLNIKYKQEKQFKWLVNRKYDFYIKSLNCIIETHGNQHYGHGFSPYGGRTLEEEQENDKIKEVMARENGIKNYIVIDCRRAELEFIKRNIIKSKISGIFDISDINYAKCHEYALKSIVKEACELWNSGVKSTEKIGEFLRMNRTTIRRYLKQGAILGWCEYDAGEVKKRRIVQLSKEGQFIKEWGSMVEAVNKLNIKSNHISEVCAGKTTRTTSGGFKWMFKEDYESLNKDTILLINRSIKELY